MNISNIFHSSKALSSHFEELGEDRHPSHEAEKNPQASLEQALKQAEKLFDHVAIPKSDGRLQQVSDAMDNKASDIPGQDQSLQYKIQTQMSDGENAEAGLTKVLQEMNDVLRHLRP
jgi:hypothetical protein